MVPGLGAWRPLLDVTLSDDPGSSELCLIDSGALEVRLSRDRALTEGLALPTDPNGPDIFTGGVRSQVYRTRHRLRVNIGTEVVAWTTGVCFCDPWPHPVGLLGQRGFFDAFDVQFFGRDRQFRCTSRRD